MFGESLFYLNKQRLQMNTDITPLFIFSLPRAGSTMTQRILASHPRISTTAETWLLLPLIYTLRNEGVYAKYKHKFMVSAIRDFSSEMPHGINDYLDSMRSFVLSLYGKAANAEAAYFLDKTPRYHLIVDEIIEMFPSAKFIFLWRNPLSVIASITDTFGSGKWRMYDYKVDIYEGLDNLIKAYMKNKGDVIAVRFEDLIREPEIQLKKIFNYLELPFYPDAVSNFTNVNFHGSLLGDQTGIKKYKKISPEPLEKWKQTLASPLRKIWCRNYLQWIGKDRLKVMGYNYEELLTSLKAIDSGTKYLCSDICRMSLGVGMCGFDLRIIWHKINKIPDWHKIIGYG